MPARRPHEASGLQEPAAVAGALLYAAERFQSNQLQPLRESFCQLGAFTELLLFRYQLQSPRPALRRRALPEQPAAVAAREFLPPRRTCPLAGASFEEVGYHVKQALLTTRLRLGQVAQILRDTHVGAAALTQAAPELLPLPVPQSSVEEANLRSAEAAGATPQHLRADSPRSLKDRRAATAGTSS